MSGNEFLSNEIPNLARISSQLDNISQSDQAPPSLSADIKRRPFRYIMDLANCAAIRFSIGNGAFAIFLGAVADVPVGGWGALGIQSGITVYTASRQVQATYRGEDFGAPFRAQAYANWLTAAVLLAAGLTGGPKRLAMTVLPVVTLILWGKSHWDIANYLNRRAELQKYGLSENEIEADARIKRFEKLYMIQTGGADMIAPYKNQPIDHIARTLQTLTTNPLFLTGGQLVSLIPLPFFAAGLAKSFFKKAPIVKNPNNAYAMGYAVGAVATLVKVATGAPGDFLFVAAQVFWSGGYRALVMDKTRGKTVSAVEYAALQGSRAKKPGSSPPSLAA